MIELAASGRSATATRSFGSRSAMMKALPLARISLAFATTSAFAGTMASTSSKAKPTNVPAWLASLMMRRAPWMPLSVTIFSE